jgi:hypothetical protein
LFADIALPASVVVSMVSGNEFRVPVLWNESPEELYEPEKVGEYTLIGYADVDPETLPENMHSIAVTLRIVILEEGTDTPIYEDAPPLYDDKPPFVPDEPGEPDESDKPDEPGDSEGSDEPNEPGDSEGSDGSDKPNEPGDSEEPGEPADPEDPADTGATEDPMVPDDPSDLGDSPPTSETPANGAGNAETSNAALSGGGAYSIAPLPTRQADGQATVGEQTDIAAGRTSDFPDEPTIPRGAVQFANPFSDIAQSDWFYEDVMHVYASGLFRGTSDTTFSPDAPITRGMLVTVLARLFSADTDKYTESHFSDVPPGAWYLGPVEWAAERGIVIGIGDGLFAPDVAISRQEMAVMLMNYALSTSSVLPVMQAAAEFADGGDIADWAAEAVQSARQAGIMDGRPGNLFDPKGEATRAEAAAIIRRYTELV